MCEDSHFSDKELEELWEQFGDVPMNPETECLEAPFFKWDAIFVKKIVENPASRPGGDEGRRRIH
ncbi:MAG: hypothetical protein K2O18_00910 [Oscillospiraceae bacterium]|nr:hypothetical protein [Oscillospiraceae bacterium]